MPDFGSPVAAGVNPLGQGIQTLSGLMGIQTSRNQQALQQQQLQSGALGIQQQQLQMPVAANAGQAAEQEQAERSKITQMFQSGKDDQGNSIIDPKTGEPNPSAVLPALGRMAPLTGQQYAQNILKTITAKVGLQSAATGLDSAQKAALMGPIQSLATNPTDEQIGAVNSTLDQWGQQHPEMAPNVAQAKFLVSHIQSVPDPAKRSEMANRLAALFQGGQAVQTQSSQPSVNTGGQTVFMNQPPPATGAPPTVTGSIDNTLPPGGQNSIQSDAQQNQYVAVRDARGNIVGTRPVPGATTGGAGGTGPVNLPPNMTPEQRNSLAAEVSSQATQAGQAGAMHAINQQIYDLAGKPSTTNMYGQIGSKLRQTIGVDPLPGNSADDYDTMTKMLAQSNMRAAQAMGVHTDAQSAQVAQASGSQHYDPKALKNVVSVNDGMVKAQQMYATGLANAIDTKGYGAANAFKTQWGSVFDLGASEYMAAKDSGDPTRLAETKTKLGLNDPKKAAALAAKIKAMHDLAGMP